MNLLGEHRHQIPVVQPMLWETKVEEGPGRVPPLAMWMDGMQFRLLLLPISSHGLQIILKCRGRGQIAIFHQLLPMGSNILNWMPISQAMSIKRCKQRLDQDYIIVLI